MLEISKIIGENIKNLMENNNVSNRSLSEVIGISHPTLGKYLSGDQPIDSEKLMLIARYFNKPFEYFFKTEQQEVNFLYRSDGTGEHEKELEYSKIVNAIEGYLSIIDKPSVNFLPPKYTLSEMSDDKLNEIVEKIAMEQRRLFGIESMVPANYYDAVSQMGIHVLVRPFHCNHCFGLSLYSKDNGCFILVNDDENIPEERKIFSLFHEYAHLMFHRDQYLFDGLKHLGYERDFDEKCANKFAEFFLVPRHLLQSYFLNSNQINIIDVKQDFKISLQTMAYALYDYQKINKKQYYEFWERIKSNNLNKIEIKPIDQLDVMSKNSKIMHYIKLSYLQDNISVNKISEILGLDIIKTRELVRKWGSIDEEYLSIQ